ncbi:MAG: DJ-1/PfpI family protein [Bacteroidales bacterium]|nr:DJ-1/PfpI family protein [Bacteroidales bacterium]
MSKKVAVLTVNPVNGAGLFQYLEAFFENHISYQTFAVAKTTQIRTNSGIRLQMDDVVANLQGRENEFDALVFACGDAMPKFANNVDEQYYQDLLSVIEAFSNNGKILVGHCVAALLFDNLGIGKGKKVALHPFVKAFLTGCIGTNEQVVIDGNMYTAQTENSLPLLLPKLLEVLK